MRAFEFLSERVAAMRAPAKAEVPAPMPTAPSAAVNDDQTDSPEITALKSVLSSKIKELPTDPSTMKLLQEIEDLLASIGAGSRSKYIGSALQTIEDPDVNKAQKLLAKYFMSLDASPKDRQDMLSLWKADKLVNINVLLKPGKNTVASLINGYDKNPAIKEMTDDLSQVAALGQGKGEFMLSVFSKKITKADKGDLAISGMGTVEVKTTDKGAGRFMDQQVKPTAQYQNAVNDFRKTFKDVIVQQNIKSSGISIANLIKINGALNVKQRPVFIKKLTAAVANLFPSAPDMVGPIVDSIVAGNANQAKQRYAVANLNNYMEQKKEDIGILAINLAKDPYTFVFFTDNKSLNAGGMRLHSGTGYPIAADFRDAYPQTDIVDTSIPQE
jgi:hypothetical protein